MTHRVVITGIGVIGPHGVGIEQLISSVANEPPQFSPWPSAHNPPNPSATIANIKDYPKTRYFTERQLRLMDRAMSLSSFAAGLALEDAGFGFNGSNEITDGSAKAVPEDTATFMGTTRAENPSGYQFTSPLLPGGNGRLNAADFPMIARNISCGQTAIRFKLKGPSSVLASGQLASFEAVNRAHDFVRMGRSEVTLAGGFEVLSKFSLYIARHHYGENLSAERPQFFGLNPGYLVPSEGSCMLVLESAEHAEARGALVYAVLDGWYAGRFGRRSPSQDLLNAWSSLLRKVGKEAKKLGLMSVVAGGSNRPHELAEREALASFCDDSNVPFGICTPRSLVGEGESWTAALQIALAARLLSERRNLPTWHLATDAPRTINERSRGGSINGTTALVSGVDPTGAYNVLHLSGV